MDGDKAFLRLGRSSLASSGLTRVVTVLCANFAVPGGGGRFDAPPTNYVHKGLRPKTKQSVRKLVKNNVGTTSVIIFASGKICDHPAVN